MAVRFFLDKTRQKKSGGEVLVRCSISIRGKRLTTTAGFSILPELWDQNKQKVKLSTIRGKSVIVEGLTARDLNSRLKRIDSFFSDYEAGLKRDNKEPGDLKEIFAQQFGRKAKTLPSEADEKEPDIKERLEDFLREQCDKMKWRALTVRSMNSFKQHMNDFIDANMMSSIGYFDEDGTTRLVNYLINVKGLRNSTIEKYTSRLRYFIRWAGRKGYTSLKADYKPRLQKTMKPIVFLEWDDLMKLFYFEFPDVGTKLKLIDVHGNEYEKRVGLERKTMEQVRDLFCFSCFT
jgi:hypothetical protein